MREIQFPSTLLMHGLWLTTPRNCMQILNLMQAYADSANTCSNCGSTTIHDRYWLCFWGIFGALYQFYCFNMDFLKSAVASAISKDPPFPYKFGDRLTVDQSIWALHNGTKRVCVLQDNVGVYSWLTLGCVWRKTVQTVAFSHSISQQTDPAYHSLEMLYGKCEHWDTLG